MKRFILFLQFLFVLNIGTFSANRDSLIWKNLKNAIELGAEQYIKDGRDKPIGNEVFVIKVISCSKNRGEFSISYILNDYDYETVKASNYCESGNKLILIKTDSLKALFTKKSGFPLINDQTREKAYSILAGPNECITAQWPSVMIFNYKRKKITHKYFLSCTMTEWKYNYLNDKR